MPGPEVEVIARAPPQTPPRTIPIAASSSSACTIAARIFPVCGSMRYCLQSAINDSHSDDEGVIGYQAATEQPPMTQPSAAARLPSMKSKPSVPPATGVKRYGSDLTSDSRTKALPSRAAPRLSVTDFGFDRN